jgi:tryptophan-rich hypothetical protein|tara:strand:- start:599 stop:814 length:216 start_codon:yes stop_codon:yes gene_type:complete
MNRINPAKLMKSKWTALEPRNKEKHFLVTEIEFNEDGSVNECIIEAIMSKNIYSIDWVDLKDENKWLQGWK